LSCAVAEAQRAVPRRRHRAAQQRRAQRVLLRRQLRRRRPPRPLRLRRRSQLLRRHLRRKHPPSLRRRSQLRRKHPPRKRPPRPPRLRQRSQLLRRHLRRRRPRRRLLPGSADHQSSPIGPDAVASGPLRCVQAASSSPSLKRRRSTRLMVARRFAERSCSDGIALSPLHSDIVVALPVTGSA
jgi:hypothetical protein